MRVVVILMVLALSLCSCKGLSEGYLKASEISPSVNAVVERHNALLRGEMVPGTIGDEKAAAWVLEATVLKAIVDRAVSPEGEDE